jgi:iduronate 2-sulfatase
MKMHLAPPAPRPILARPRDVPLQCQPMKMLLAVLLLATSTHAAAEPQQKPRRLNVLYVIVDDLRPELGFNTPNGNTHISTPHVDALAAKSVVFDRAYVQQGVCGPTRNSFLSGRRPDTTHVWNFKQSFRETPNGKQWTALPQAFKEAGFLSAGFGKTYHPSIPKAYDCPNFPSDCPSWSVPYQPGARKGSKNGVPPNGCANVSESGETGCASGAWEACNDPDDLLLDGNVTNLAIAQLRKAKAAETPFFINVGIHKPHVPWVFPARFLNAQPSTAETDLPAHRIEPVGMPPVAYYRCENLCNDSVVGVGCFNRSVPFAAGYTREFRRAYRAAVRQERRFGRLVCQFRMDTDHLPRQARDKRQIQGDFISPKTTLVVFLISHRFRGWTFSSASCSPN